MVRPLTIGKRLLLVVLIATVSLSFSSSYGSTSEHGHPFDLVLLDLEGKEIRLDAFANGKPLLLYFWATWCKPCRKTQPLVADIHKKYKDRIKVLGINVGGVDSLEAIKEYKSSHRISYPMLVDRDNTVARAYKINAIPTIIVSNSTGVTLYRGNWPPADLEKLLSR
jgi:thiol-disulfide isomerase/thioredoxin